MPEHRYYAAAKALGPAVAISINDAPLIVDPDAAGIATTKPINPWIIGGENHVGVMLRWPRDKPYEAGVADVSARVFIADPGSQSPHPGRVLAEFRFPAATAPEGYPLTRRLAFDVQDPPPTRLWNDAEPLDEITDADRRDIAALAAKLHRALQSGDAQQAYDLQAYKYEDIARAEYKPIERFRDAIMEQHEWFREQGPFVGEPLAVDDAEFDLIARNRLVAMNRPDHKPGVLLRQEKGDIVVGIPIYAARIAGKWTLAR